jgi:hypothetical protein
MHVGCKPRRPPIRSTPQPTPAADKIRAACERATADGVPITHAYLQSTTGMGKDSVWHAVDGMRRRGEFPWTIVLIKQAGRRPAKVRPKIGRDDPWGGAPSPREILSRSRAVLVGLGFPVEAADVRLGAKAARYGGSRL